MVDIHTMRRVLALDLGLDAQAIESCLASSAMVDLLSADTDKISLADALRIVATAEALTLATAS